MDESLKPDFLFGGTTEDVYGSVRGLMVILQGALLAVLDPTKCLCKTHVNFTLSPIWNFLIETLDCF